MKVVEQDISSHENMTRIIDFIIYITFVSFAWSDCIDNKKD
jgi:hypothetical protein